MKKNLYRLREEWATYAADRLFIRQNNCNTYKYGIYDGT